MALVLTCKSGESLTIGDSITITVRRRKSNQVRVAIIAPKELRIERCEKKAKNEPTPA